MPYLRSRTHQTHVADKNIDELRKFINLELAYEVAAARNSRIMSTDSYKASLVSPDLH